MNIGLPTTPSGSGKQVAIPKSIILALRCSAKQTTFCNLRSRWQIPIACSSPMPISKSCQMPLASSSQNLFLRASMQLQRSRLPWKYSVTMQQLALDLKKSSMRMTWWIWLAFCRDITQDWYFWKDFSLAYTLNLFIFFKATCSPVSLCFARNTEPQVPVPRMSPAQQTYSLTTFTFSWLMLLIIRLVEIIQFGIRRSCSQENRFGCLPNDFVVLLFRHSPYAKYGTIIVIFDQQIGTDEQL